MPFNRERNYKADLSSEKSESTQPHVEGLKSRSVSSVADIINAKVIEDTAQNRQEFKKYDEAHGSRSSLLLFGILYMLGGAAIAAYTFAVVGTYGLDFDSGKDRIVAFSAILGMIMCPLLVLDMALIIWVDFKKKEVKKEVTEDSILARVSTRKAALQDVFLIGNAFSFSLLLNTKAWVGHCEAQPSLFQYIYCSGTNEDGWGSGEHALALGTSTALLLIPMTFYFLARNISTSVIITVWGITVLSLALTMIVVSWQSVIGPFLLIAISVFIIYQESHRRIQAMYVLVRKLQFIITENERLAEAREANEMRAMIGNVAHDLKTPLASFLSGVDMIAGMIDDAENMATSTPQGQALFQENILPIRGCLDSIHNTNAFMIMTINRCIDYTKASKGLKLIAKPETIDLRDALELPLHVMRDMQQRLEIIMDEAPLHHDICSHIITDKQWLQENLLCLLSNAVKYSSKGKVEISLSLLPEKIFTRQKLQILATPSTANLDGTGAIAAGIKKPIQSHTINVQKTHDVPPNPQGVSTWLAGGLRKLIKGGEAHTAAVVPTDDCDLEAGSMNNHHNNNNYSHSHSSDSNSGKAAPAPPITMAMIAKMKSNARMSQRNLLSNRDLLNDAKERTDSEKKSLLHYAKVASVYMYNPRASMKTPATAATTAATPVLDVPGSTTNDPAGAGATTPVIDGATTAAILAENLKKLPSDRKIPIISRGPSSSGSGGGIEVTKNSSKGNNSNKSSNKNQSSSLLEENLKKMPSDRKIPIISRSPSSSSSGNGEKKGTTTNAGTTPESPKMTIGTAAGAGCSAEVNLNKQSTASGAMAGPGAGAGADSGPALKLAAAHLLTKEKSEMFKSMRRFNSTLDAIKDDEESLATDSRSDIPMVLRFEVQDSGIGLSDEAMKNLFNPFKQAQRLAGGTGLGLFSLAKRLEAMKGYYGVKKRLDGKQGSIFWFAIQYRPDTASAEMHKQQLQQKLQQQQQLQLQQQPQQFKFDPVLSHSGTIYQHGSSNGAFANGATDSSKQSTLCPRIGDGGGYYTRRRSVASRGSISSQRSIGSAVSAAMNAVADINNHHAFPTAATAAAASGGGYSSSGGGGAVSGNRTGSTSNNSSPRDGATSSSQNTSHDGATDSKQATTATTIASQSSSVGNRASAAGSTIVGDYLSPTASGGSKPGTSKTSPEMFSSSTTTVMEYVNDGPPDNDDISVINMSEKSLLSAATGQATAAQQHHKSLPPLSYGESMDTVDSLTSQQYDTTSATTQLTYNQTAVLGQLEPQQQYNDSSIPTTASFNSVSAMSTIITPHTKPAMHILLVDDSFSILKMTRMMLQRQGHVVTTAENGMEAIDRLDERLEEIDKAFDVVLMDLQMPVLDGLETIRRIRAQEKQRIIQTASADAVQQFAIMEESSKRNAQVIVSYDENSSLKQSIKAGQHFKDRRRQLTIGCSANSDHETMQEALNAGMDGFLAKPFSIDTFYEIIDKFLLQKN